MSSIIDYNFLPVTIDNKQGTRSESSHRSTEVFMENVFICQSLSCPCPYIASYRGSKGIAPLILNVSARWPLCPENEPQYLSNRRVNRPQRQSERLRKERNLLRLLVFELNLLAPELFFLF